ncbi:putative C6 transcription factor [Talaromyces proteolyticus]|uniref:C6 transcription factor n=1 Tax=Talaromyces proteolyticus TaxID=1131652 RepID=A0AAD4KR50_9EURO|nr:putative C6 transcription factor [Talaromyces proteolyticus]KAH8697460.1 putative C6 transcription factor [Talaromyces proteolyticus]
MSSAAFLDNPVLKVSRPVAACSRCRTAKIKCDGKLPACSACERANKASSCSGASDEFAKGKERSYVASLEGYCERLEKHLAEVRQRKQMRTLAAGGVGGEQIPESSITAFATDDTSSQAHHKEVSDIDDLVGDFGFLSVNSTSRDFSGITSNVSFAQLLLTTSTVEPLPQFSNASLLPRYEATQLMQHYFNTIYIQLPFFSEITFWTSMEAVYQNEGRFAKPIDQWMVRMVLAIASASLWPQQHGNDPQFALSMVSTALEFSAEVLRPGSMLGIQAILFLTQYSLFDPTHFRPRFLVSFAARVMVDLGLHQDPPIEVLSDKARLDQRRRLFYSLYSIDRVICTALRYHFSFSDNSVDVNLPIIPKSSADPTNGNFFLKSLEPAIHLFKIRRILSTGYHEMYCNGRNPSPQPLVLTWKLCAEAREWYDQTPSSPSSSLNLLYRLELLYSTILFLSPSYRNPVICDFSKVLLFDRCIDYISQFHQVVDKSNSLPFATFLDIQRVRQIGQRFVTILNEDYDLLISDQVPEPPQVPAGTPEPPYLAAEDRINCLARAFRCLLYIEDILKYGVQRWDTRQQYNEFIQDSATVKLRLEQHQQSFQTTRFADVPSGFIPAMPTNGYQEFQPYVNAGEQTYYPHLTNHE